MKIDHTRKRTLLHYNSSIWSQKTYQRISLIQFVLMWRLILSSISRRWLTWLFVIIINLLYWAATIQPSIHPSNYPTNPSQAKHHHHIIILYHYQHSTIAIIVLLTWYIIGTFWYGVTSHYLQFRYRRLITLATKTRGCVWNQFFDETIRSTYVSTYNNNKDFILYISNLHFDSIFSII